MKNKTKIAHRQNNWRVRRRVVLV